MGRSGTDAAPLAGSDECALLLLLLLLLLLVRVRVLVRVTGDVGSDGFGEEPEVELIGVDFVRGEADGDVVLALRDVETGEGASHAHLGGWVAELGEAVEDLLEAVTRGGVPAFDVSGGFAVREALEPEEEVVAPVAGRFAARYVIELDGVAEVGLDLLVPDAGCASDPRQFMVGGNRGCLLLPECKGTILSVVIGRVVVSKVARVQRRVIS